MGSPLGRESEAGRRISSTVPYRRCGRRPGSRASTFGIDETPVPTMAWASDFSRKAMGAKEEVHDAHVDCLSRNATDSFSKTDATG